MKSLSSPSPTIARGWPGAIGAPRGRVTRKARFSACATSASPSASSLLIFERVGKIESPAEPVARAFARAHMGLECSDYGAPPMEQRQGGGALLSAREHALGRSREQCPRPPSVVLRPPAQRSALRGRLPCRDVVSGSAQLRKAMIRPRSVARLSESAASCRRLKIMALALGASRTRLRVGDVHPG